MSASTDHSTAVRQVRFRAPGQIELVTAAPSLPNKDEVVVAPLAVGVCGTDSHIIAGSFPAVPNVVLGHEVCGRVMEVGSNVPQVQMGDLVTVEPHRYCTWCPYCRNGQEHLCENKRGYGVHLDGGMTDRMVVPARIAYRLPEDTPPWVGALTEPLACCVHGMDRLGAQSGQPLLVMGAGPAGLMLVTLARLQGLSPIAVLEPSPERRRTALILGADIAADPLDPTTAEQLDDLTDGRGFPFVVDAVGSGALLEQAVANASRGGTVLVFGVSRPDDVAKISPYELFSRELSLVSAVINPWTHQRAVALLPRLGLDRLRPVFCPLDQVEEAVRAQRDGVGDKVIVVPAGEAAARGVTRARPVGGVTPNDALSYPSRLRDTTLESKD